jgi:hypothetical protein
MHRYQRRKIATPLFVPSFDSDNPGMDWFSQKLLERLLRNGGAILGPETFAGHDSQDLLSSMNALGV